MLIVLYSLYKSTLRILKRIKGRGLGGPQNPEKWEKWAKIQTSGHGSRVKKTFLRLHTPGFSIWYIYLVIQGSGQKIWENFEKKGPPNAHTRQPFFMCYYDSYTILLSIISFGRKLFFWQEIISLGRKLFR